MPAPMYISRRDGPYSNGADPSRSPLLHPALSTSLSRSFGLNSPFSLSALSTSLTALSSSPGFNSMSMSIGRSFEERPKLEAQFFRNFTCCGLDLQDLHGLLEHFEECHVAFENDSNDGMGGMGGGGMEVEMDMDDGASEGTISGPPSPRLGHHAHGQGGIPGKSIYELKKSALSNQFDPNANSISAPNSPATNQIGLDAGMELDMEMEMDDPTPPPPFAPVSTAMAMPSNTTSLPGSAFQPPPMSAFDNPLTLQAGASKKKFSTAMNAHPLGGSMRGMGMGMGGLVGVDALAAARQGSAYTTPDHSVPGTPVMEEIPGGGVDNIFSVPGTTTSVGTVGGSLAPSLLFPGSGPPSSAADSPPSDHGSNRSIEDSSSGQGSKESTPNLPSMGPGTLSALPSALHPLGTGVQISPSGRPYTPPSEKPFKCSVQGCDKSYKQQNGLKYHRLHGHCNQNAVGKEGTDSRDEGKPYVCHVPSCGKRYKNMNGLRYHYQHSGAHGAQGLQMLANSIHPPPQYPPGHKRANAGSNNTSRAGSPSMSNPGSRDSSPAGFPRGLGGAGVGLGQKENRVMM